MLLAAATEAAPLLAGNLEIASVVAGLPVWQQLLAMWLATQGWSYLVSFWSDYVRRLGKKAKPWMLSVSFVLNLSAGNPHKAARARTAAKKAGEVES